MKSRAVLTLGIVALLAVFIWMSSPQGIMPTQKNKKLENITNPEPPAITGTAIPFETSSPVAAGGPVVTAKPRTEESRAPSRRDFSNPLTAPSFQESSAVHHTTPDANTGEIIDQIHLMFRNYRAATGESPVGTNAEIMKSIMGGNSKGAMLGPPEGQTVNGNGELLDSWGTPYFFHQLTSDVIEIHSAGPDQRLWTEDDVVSK